MKEKSPGNAPFAKNNYRFSLKRSHIVVIVVASLLAILVYWLTLQQGAPIAGALA